MSDTERPLVRARRLVRERQARIAELRKVMASTDWRVGAEERAASDLLKGHNVALRVLVRHVELLEQERLTRPIREQG